MRKREQKEMEKAVEDARKAEGERIAKEQEREKERKKIVEELVDFSKRPEKEVKSLLEAWNWNKEEVV